MSNFRLLPAVCGCSSHNMDRDHSNPNCRFATNAYYEVVECFPDGSETVLVHMVRYAPGTLIVRALENHAKTVAFFKD